MSTPASLSWPPNQASQTWSEQFHHQVQSLIQAWQRLPLYRYLRPRWLEWSGLGLGIVGLVVALVTWNSLNYQFFSSVQASVDSFEVALEKKQEGAPIASASASVSNSTATSAIDHSSAITVYITGAVKKPGVYHLASTSLFMNAVLAAGGFSSSVWQDYLDQFVNLAQPLTDHQKIWIPKLDQQALLMSLPTGRPISTEQPLNSTQSLTPAETASSTASLISINSASLQELLSLNGIGDKRAGDIVANRPYQSLTELVSKAKIPESTFQEIQAQIKL